MHRVISILISKFHYGNIGKKYYGRIGKMIDRYGTSLIVETIDSLSFEPDNLTHLLNVVEKCCQDKIAKSDTKVRWQDL